MNPTTSRLCGIAPTQPKGLTVSVGRHHGETYAWVCTAGREAELVQRACRFAADPDLLWTFHDSTLLVKSLAKAADLKCEGK